MRNKESLNEPGTVLVVREIGWARFDDSGRDSFIIRALEPKQTETLYRKASEPITAEARFSGKQPIVALKIPMHVLPIDENGDIIATTITETKDNKRIKKRLITLQNREEVVIQPMKGWDEQGFIQSRLPDIPGSRITHLQLTAEQLDQLRQELGKNIKEREEQPNTKATSE